MLHGGALVIGFPYNDQLVDMKNMTSDHSFDYSEKVPTHQILNSMSLNLPKIFVRSDSAATKMELRFDPMPIKAVSNTDWRWLLTQCSRMTFH